MEYGKGQEVFYTRNLSGDTSGKSNSRQIRLDHECEETLQAYCSQEGILHSEGIRRGIKKLKYDVGDLEERVSMTEVGRLILGLRSSGWQEKDINDFLLYIAKGDAQYKPVTRK